MFIDDAITRARVKTKALGTGCLVEPRAWSFFLLFSFSPRGDICSQSLSFQDEPYYGDLTRIVHRWCLAFFKIHFFCFPVLINIRISIPETNGEILLYNFNGATRTWREIEANGKRKYTGGTCCAFFMKSVSKNHRKDWKIINLPSVNAR